MAHCRYFVIFPRVIVNIAHPCFHLSGVGFDNHKSAVHKANHVSNAVHRAHFTHFRSVVGKHLYGMRQIEIVENRIGVPFVFLIIILVGSRSLSYLFDEVWNLALKCIAPRWGRTPMFAESTLDYTHLFKGRLFCILLNSCVERSVYFQTIGEKVETMLAVITGNQSTFT